jgi:hypothetical protein
MSITTERPVRTEQHQQTRRAVRTRQTESQRRATMQRRRHVGVSAVRGGQHDRRADGCADQAHRSQRITVLGAVAGVVGTAVVLLALVGMANLRASSLESVSAPSHVTVQVSDGTVFSSTVSGSTVSGSTVPNGTVGP